MLYTSIMVFAGKNVIVSEIDNSDYLRFVNNSPYNVDTTVKLYQL